MAILIKRKARKPMARAKPSAWWAPHGVGGMLTNEPCIGVDVGDFKLVLTLDEFEELKQQATRLMELP